jgi:O-antigen/teichoic acid export membrane protein
VSDGSALTPPADQPPPSEVTGGRLLRNTFVNGVASVSGAVVTLALTPFLLDRLGPAQYGVWLLALTLTFSSGYAALADLGLPEAAVRFIAEARASNDTLTINEIVSTVTAVFALIGLGAAIAIAALAGPLVGLFNVGSDLEATARGVFVIMAVGVVIDLPVSGLLSVIEGAQHYPWLRGIELGGRLAWAAIVVAAVSAGHGVTSLAAASVAVTTAEALLAVVAAHLVQPGLRIRLSHANRATLRRTFSYGSLLTVLRALSVVYAQMDRAIIGIGLTVAAVARYEVAYRIQAMAALALVVSSSAILPAAAYTAARGDTQKQRELYLRGTKYAVALAVPFALGALIYARPLIGAWVGTPYEALAGSARLFLTFPLFWCVHQIGIAMLIGLGHVKRVVLLQFVCAVVNLTASVLLVSHLGIQGVILGTLVGFGVIWIPYLRLFLQMFDLRLSDWLRRIVAPNLPGALVQAGFGLVTLRLLDDGHEIWQVGGLFIACCGLSLLTFAIVGLRRDELVNLLRHARTG